MFSIDTRALPWIKSYESCNDVAARKRVKITKRTNPIWGDNCIPLRSNDDHHLRLEWREDGEDSRWALMLYRTEVVGYFKDGRILLNASYNSTSTSRFFDTMTPNNIYLIRTRYGNAYAIGHGGDDRDVDYHLVNRDIHYDDPFGGKFNQALIVDQQGAALNPQDWPITKRVANKERRKEIRQALKPFLQWYDAMTKVGNSVRGVFGEQSAHVTVAYAEAISTLVERSLAGDTVDTEVWNKACVGAYCQVAPYWFRTARMDVDAEYIGAMRACILRRAFEQFDGWAALKVVVPAGKRP